MKRKYRGDKRKYRGDKSWIVRVRETVVREYVVSAATAEDARESFDESDDFTEIDRPDWEVEKVEPNE